MVSAVQEELYSTAASYRTKPLAVWKYSEAAEETPANPATNPQSQISNKNLRRTSRTLVRTLVYCSSLVPTRLRQC